jgi:hypothetical protein
LDGDDFEKRIFVLRWPGGPTFHHKPPLMKPTLFAEGKFFFGYEQEKTGTERYTVVVRRVSD